MAIYDPATTPKVILIELEVLFLVIATGAWGGVVRYLLKTNKKSDKGVMPFLANCLTQIIISCFTSFLLSAIAIEQGLSFNMILVFAGIGGVCSGAILKSIATKIQKIVSGITK
jgi:fluoride ion exporter CrcB/FEX